MITDDPSLDLVQAHLLLSIANYGIGNGRKCWRELGTALVAKSNLKAPPSFSLTKWNSTENRH
jgi:hypothetical protein